MQGAAGGTPPPARTPQPARRDGTSGTSDGSLPRATSLVDYYMSTTPNGKRRERRSPNIGSPADFSGIYSVWKSPTKQWWSASKSQSREWSQSPTMASQAPAYVELSVDELNTASDILSPSSPYRSSQPLAVTAQKNRPARANGLTYPAYSPPGVSMLHLPPAGSSLSAQRQQPLSPRQHNRLDEVCAGLPVVSSVAAVIQQPLSPRGQTLFLRQQELLNAVERQQMLHDGQKQQQQRITNGYYAETSPSPREISQTPRGVTKQSLEEETELGSGIPGLGLVIVNKTISVVSQGIEQALKNGGAAGKREGGGYTMTVASVQVQRIMSNSPASRCDAIAAGDEILAVNSLCCRGRNVKEVSQHISPLCDALNHFGGSQPAKPVHILSRQCLVTSDGTRRETLSHASLVPDDQPRNSITSVPAALQAHTNENDTGGLCASLGALEEALYEKLLTPREQALTPRTAFSGARSARRGGYETTWRSFPSISQSADAWDPADVKTFLEWVFWRQGSGFSISSSEYSRIPTGPQLLAMSDQGFGSMGFTHDETRVIRCMLSVLHNMAAVTSPWATVSRDTDRYTTHGHLSPRQHPAGSARWA